MKCCLIFVILAAFCTLSYGQGGLGDLEEFCQLPARIRQVIIGCVLSNLDANTQRILPQIEQCAGTTMASMFGTICTNPDLEALQRFAECEEQAGTSEMEITVDQDGVTSCIRRQLGK